MVFCSEINVPKTLLQRALFRFGEKSGLNLILEIRKILKKPYMNQAELEKYQTKKLKHIIEHAYHTVPYYKKLFDKNGIKPSDIKKISDLEKIPITTKKSLQALTFNEKVSNCFDKNSVIELTTGGSTGIPLKIYVSKRGALRRVAEGMRIKYMNGYNARHLSAFLQWNLQEPDLINSLGFFRELSFSFDMPIQKQVEKLNELKPEVIEIYPSRLNIISDYILNKKIKMYTPVVIITNSETLHDDVRQKAEKAFGIQITNVYDNWEFGRVAWQCPQHEGLHVNSDSVILQIDKSKNIICTDINNYAMPLIRYKIGDKAEWMNKPCKCGISFPLLKKVHGREGDYLRLPKGGKLASQDIGFTLRFYPIVEYQIIQKSLEVLQVNIVSKKEYGKQNDKKIVDDLKSQTGIKTVVVTHLKSIPRTSSGKLQSFVSEINNHDQGKEL